MEITELVAKMTLEEKASMVSGKDFWHTDDVKRLGIPSVMVTDGPHGLRKQVDKADNAGVNDSIEAVCFPTAAGTASSFDRALLRELGETLGNECRAEEVSVLLGPAVNIKRSPLCGRNFEYFSEDPYLAGELAQSYINGVQSQGVGTSIKHFAVNNQEKRRMTVSAVVDERTLREIYLPAFETAVKKAQPWTVMCSYNKINGVYSSENEKLLTQILRDEWGFEGYVMTDWGACNNRVKGVKAGLDLEMSSSGRYNTQKLLNAVNGGELEERVLDRACERILTRVFQYVENKAEAAVFDRKAHHEKAREVAAQSMVLLKNDGVLPLSRKQRVAIIGEFAEKPRYQGGGSSHINTRNVVGARQALRGQANVRYARGFPADNKPAIREEMERAVRLAKSSDVTVIFAGLPEAMESEGFDRSHLHLPACQNELISRIAAVQKNVVVVLHNGSPVLMPWLSEVGAVLEAYLGGEAVGEAEADLLYGVKNPSGKLAETFPLALSDTPCYRNFPGNTLTVEYREGIYVGYRYYDTAGKNVLFPFGHGLSYTQFAYRDLRLKQKKQNESFAVTVTCKVKNCGERDGAEVLQVYVAPKQSKVFRAEQELKGFEKVFLKAGEEKDVSITLESRAFAYYHVGLQDWYCESGAYEIRVGASSRDIRLRGEITLNNADEAPLPYEAGRLTAYDQCRVSNVSDEEFSRLLGFPISEPEPAPGSPEQYTLNSTLEQAKDSKWGGRFNRLIRLAGKQLNDKAMGAGDMMERMILECPLQSAIGMTQGKISEEMGEAVVSLLNNQQPLKSFGTLAKGLVRVLRKGKN